MKYIFLGFGYIQNSEKELFNKFQKELFSNETGNFPNSIEGLVLDYWYSQLNNESLGIILKGIATSFKNLRVLVLGLFTARTKCTSEQFNIYERILNDGNG